MSVLQERKAANHRLSNHPAVVALVITCLVGVLTWVLTNSEDKLSDLQLVLVYGICGCFIVYYAAGALHKVWFTAEGIEDRWCGFRYRFTPWAEVGQVIKAYQYKATAPSIVIIPRSCPVFDPEVHGRGWKYIDLHRFKLIILDATEVNTALIMQYHGDFDYES